MTFHTGAATRRGSTLRAKAVACLALSVAAFALCAGPASAKTARDEANAKDPYQKVNRVLFLANGALDIAVIRPVAITYQRIMPRPIRTGLHNAFTNLGEPTVALNDIFQGHGKNAVHTIARLAENSTIGIGGLFDVAALNGLPHHDNDFGITLAKRGFRSGPYVFIPIIGPATARDAIGYLINIGIDPFTYLVFPASTPIEYGKFVGVGLEQRAAADKDIKEITATSTDIYASLRSYYLQNREAQITGETVDVQSLPSFGPPTPDNAPAPFIPHRHRHPHRTPSSPTG